MFAIPTDKSSVFFSLDAHRFINLSLSSKIIISREKVNLDSTRISSYFLFLFLLDTLRHSLSFKIITSIEKVNLSPMSTLPFFLFDTLRIIKLSLKYSFYLILI